MLAGPLVVIFSRHMLGYVLGGSRSVFYDTDTHLIEIVSYFAKLSKLLHLSVASSSCWKVHAASFITTIRRANLMPHPADGGSD